MWRSRSNSTGAVTTCRPSGPISRVNVSPYCNTWICAVVGVTPSASRAWADEGVDEGAFAGVELADDHQEEQGVELLYRRGQRGLVVGGGAEPGQRVAQGREQVACVCKLSFGTGVENAQHFMRLTQNPPAADRTRLLQPQIIDREWQDIARESQQAADCLFRCARRVSVADNIPVCRPDVGVDLGTPR